MESAKNNFFLRNENHNTYSELPKKNYSISELTVISSDEEFDKNPKANEKAHFEQKYYNRQEDNPTSPSICLIKKDNHFNDEIMKVASSSPLKTFTPINKGPPPEFDFLNQFYHIGNTTFALPKASSKKAIHLKKTRRKGPARSYKDRYNKKRSNIAVSSKKKF
ncbi:hypothetical protein Zmor_004117 [Zophobas morio]|uniref:Uncharacterized protein n=1 Tax=Zophobas morio TaxID=2755281 RepID=A0AA38HJ58_9CUCU|nr:hypothetical protein Zmor_004117 [Zophobas morio]